MEYYECSKHQEGKEGPWKHASDPVTPQETGMGALAGVGMTGWESMSVLLFELVKRCLNVERGLRLWLSSGICRQFRHKDWEVVEQIWTA
jgi:hypothetical protein